MTDAVIITDKSSLEDHWKFLEEELEKFQKIVAELEDLDIPNQDFDDDKTPTNSLNLDSSPDFEVSPVLPVNPVSTVDPDLPDEPDSPKSTVESEKSKNSKTKVLESDLDDPEPVSPTQKPQIMPKPIINRATKPARPQATLV